MLDAIYSAVTPYELFVASLQTIYMGFGAAIFAYIIGLPVGIFLRMTERGGLTAMPRLHSVLAFAVNTLRSVPFVILLVLVIPLTRAIAGTSIGPTATLVPLTVSAAPMIAQVIYAALKEVDGGIIEAAQAMGAGSFEIVTRFMLPECLPALMQGAIISATTVIGYSAMAGCVGGGGLGDMAIRYGYIRYNSPVIIPVVIILVAIIQLTGYIGGRLCRKLDKRKI